MVKVTGKGIELSAEESEMLGEGHEFELIPNQKGMFLLIDKEKLNEKCVPKPKKEKNEEEKEIVIELIKKAKLSDLVEGKFENILDEKQKKALLSLVIEGRVFVFKLNETYKKGVYRIKEEIIEEAQREKKESEDFNAIEKPLGEYNLVCDGFMVIIGKDGASRASYTYEKQIKECILRGIRSFDGNYYLIQNDLLTSYINKSIIALTQKELQTIDELASNLKISKLLTRIICEFLKDEGELMEKKKGYYQYIK